jgi:hypothetical protein
VLSDLEKFIDASSKKLYCHSCSKGVDLIKKKGQIKSEPNTVYLISPQQANCGGMWR